MDYLKISIDITPFKEWIRDLAMAKLADAGFESFLESESGFDAYIDISAFQEDVLNNLRGEFGKDFNFSIKKELIASQNWNREWETKYFKPLLIGGECLIRGLSHSGYPGTRYEIIIEPNMAFGTGTHETTAMIIEVLIKENLQNKTVLDLGCGTGILGIFAAKRGAKKIIAADTDEKAVKSTLNNARINKIDNLDVKKGDVSVIRNEKFDIIIANIYKNILIEYIPVFSQLMNEKGKLFISGFLKQDSPRLKSEAEKEGLKETSSITKNNWEVLVFSKI